MWLQNLHTHTVYSDGEDSMEDMVLAAIEKGFTALGISDHNEPYGFEWLIKPEEVPVYFAELERLREKYAGKIELYAGFEYDSLYPVAREGLDFIIGSVHHVRGKDGELHCIDSGQKQFAAAVSAVGDGDARPVVEAYYELIAQMAVEHRPDIIGHADIIKKNNRNGAYFDENSAWYRGLLEKTAERLSESGCIVEVNTGGISRGYRSEPYPSRYFLGLLRELNVPLTLSSDAHRAEHLDSWFSQARTMLRELGVRSLRGLRGGRFVDMDF